MDEEMLGKLIQQIGELKGQLIEKEKELEIETHLLGQYVDVCDDLKTKLEEKDKEIIDWMTTAQIAEGESEHLQAKLTKYETDRRIPIAIHEAKIKDLKKLLADAHAEIEELKRTA